MQPHAHTYGLRIIRINNRDYADSTRYTDAELADLASKDTEVQAAAVRRWGTETASFLRFVCERLGVPPASDGVGGIVLVAEGLGNVAALAILGDERTMGPGLTAALAPFLRTVVLYGTYVRALYLRRGRSSQVAPRCRAPHAHIRSAPG